MHLLGGEQEAAQHLLAVCAVAAAGEATQVAPQVSEPAFPQVGGAQSVSPARGKSEERQYMRQLRLKLLDHLRRGPAPTGAETQRPMARLPFILCFPNPPELPPKFPPLKPPQTRSELLQIAEPVRQTELLPRARINDLRCTAHGRFSIADDELDAVQSALPQAREQALIVVGGFFRGRLPVQHLEGTAVPHAHGHQQHAFSRRARHASSVAQIDPIHHQGPIALRRNRFVPPLLDLLVGVLQHGTDRGGGEATAQKAPHPVHHFALTEPAHGQREQHLVQSMPLIALQQTDLFPPAQPWNTHLLQTAPQRGPALAHRVAPALPFHLGMMSSGVSCLRPRLESWNSETPFLFFLLLSTENLTVGQD